MKKVNTEYINTVNILINSSQGKMEKKEKAKTVIDRNRALVNSFVSSMAESIRNISSERLSESEIAYLSEYTVNRMDFNNEWQMHKGLGYFAKKAVEMYLQK